MGCEDINMIKTADELVEYAIEQYESPLIGYATGFVHDVDRAKDIVQDTFIKLYKQDVEKVKKSLKAWLYTVCRNRALDVLRKEKRMVSVESEEIERDSISLETPGDEILKKERMARLFEYMEKLSENQKDVIQMKFQYGLSYQEIEKKTGLTSGNIGFLIHGGLKKLREILPENL